MDNKPRRRWFQFRLRTLFVVVTVVAVCIAVGWFPYHINWIRQRDAFIGNRTVIPIQILLTDKDMGRFVMYGNRSRQPLGLRVLGERGVMALGLGQATDEELQEAISLFPETWAIVRTDRTGKPQFTHGYFGPE